MSSFVESICRIGIFMIAAQAVIHFAPAAKYEKYMKLVVGIIVLLQLLAPINKITNGIDSGLGEGADWSARLADMEMELERGLAVEEENSFSKKIVAEMEKEIKSRLNSALNDENYSILKVNVVMDSSDGGNGQYYIKYDEEDNNSYEKYRLNMIQVYVMARDDKHDDGNGSVGYESYADGNVNSSDKYADGNADSNYSYADNNVDSNDRGDNADNSGVVKIEKVHINKIGADKDDVNVSDAGQRPSDTYADIDGNSRAASGTGKEGNRQKENGRLREMFAATLGVEEKYMEVSIYGWAE